MKKKTGRTHKGIWTGLLIAVAGMTGVISGVNALHEEKNFQRTYTVKRILDGDSFDSGEDLPIRVASVNTPEKGLCGSEEATAELKKLIWGKPITLKIVYFDMFDRAEALVYYKDVYVNHEMIAVAMQYMKRKMQR